MNIADRRLFAFKLPPLRADNGPAGGLPQALSGPHLGHGTRDDALMLIGVQFVVRRCFSAPQSRSASPFVAFAAAARARHCRLPRPCRAQQAVQSGLLCFEIVGARLLAPQPSDVTGAHDEGKGGGGEGGTIIALFGTILLDARRRLCAAAAYSRPFDPACCVEK